MKEIDFEQLNLERWRETEQLVKKGVFADPDVLVKRYNELNEDLSYARAHFRGGYTEAYLNELLSKAHQSLYRNKKERLSRAKDFWLRELPLLWYQHRRYLLISFLFFSLAVLIGVFSAIQDANFVRYIMGDAYVNMTLGNIDEGDPMAVYKKMRQSDMFFAITINNIRVSFMAYLGGLLAGFGSVFILIQNGIMLGSFQYFFNEFGLLWETILVIWIHGTIEISAIIIAGGAGITMGSGMLFPGSYPRLTSFKHRGRDGLKMIFGLIPFFIIAGFLESYVTRHTDMHVVLSLFIILGSLALVIWYFIIFPAKVAGKNGIRTQLQSKISKPIGKTRPENAAETKPSTIRKETIYGIS